MYKLLILIIVHFIAINNATAQKTLLSLREAVRTGVENNLSLQGARQEMLKAEIGQSESRAKLLPVIEGSANFQDNVRRGVMMLDGAALSQLTEPILGIEIPYMENMGLRYNTSAGVQLSVPLYNRGIYTGMGIAERLKELVSYGYEKAREDLTVEICRTYYTGQTAAEQISLLRGNIAQMNELSEITGAFHDNGMALDVDVKRVRINVENLQSRLESAVARYEQQLNLLRYILNLPFDMEFELEPLVRDNAADFGGGLSENLYELKMLDARNNLFLQQEKAINNGYLPSLAFVTNVGAVNSVDYFNKYFNSEAPAKWHGHFYWGLSLKVPVFDAQSKKYQRDKLNTEYVKNQLLREDTGHKLQAQYFNMLSELQNSERDYQKQYDNYALSVDVYAITVERYKEGMTSMTELLQDDLRKSEAQNNYLMALYKCKLSELGLMKLTGKIENFFLN